MFIRTYTVPEVAKMLRVSKNTAYELVYTGKLKSIKVSPKRGIRVPEECLRTFLQQE